MLRLKSISISQLVCSLPLLLAACCLFPLPTRADDANTSLPRVPEGFVIEQVAASPMVQHPMMGGFDDRGRLFVAASAGKNLRSDDLLKEFPNSIQMLVDEDGDGKFDKATTFADQMTFPQGALWYRGALYVASPPHIWRLEDTNDDGVADKREILVDKFGFNGNAASIHGCFLAPDGRIHWCDGRHGHEFKDEDGNITSKGKAARLFSANIDGSDVEIVMTGGMDNPVEVDFWPTGEMLGTCNLMYGRPRGDVIAHWIEGGVFPRHDQGACISEFLRTGELMPPIVKLGHIAVSGMLRYRSSHFGDDFTNNLFVTEFNTHRLTRSIITRDGASFTSREEEFMVSENPDFHPTDVIEDADGSLLVIDTGGWFRIGCPTSQVAKPEIHGAIYRIRRTDGKKWNDPRGKELNLKKKSPDMIALHLGDERPVVREAAIDLLAQGNQDALAAIGQYMGDSNPLVRQNVVWVLARRAKTDEHALPLLREMLSDTNEEVRLTAVTAIGKLRDKQSTNQLANLATEDTPAIRRQAATALGRIAEAAKKAKHSSDNHMILESLFESLKTVSTADRFLEHALIYAVIRVADREQTIPFLKHTNPRVRRGALIALDQMPDGNLTRELVTPLLDTDDGPLQREALAVISQRDGWADETTALLQKWLTEPNIDETRKSLLRGVLLAQSNDEKTQQLIADTLLAQKTAEPTAALLLEVIERSVIPEFPASWQPALLARLQHGSVALKLQTVRIIQSKELVDFDDHLSAVVNDDNSSTALRLEALTAIVSRIDPLPSNLFAFLSKQLSGDVDPFQHLTVARALAAAKLNEPQLIELAKRFPEAGPLAAPILLQAYSQKKNHNNKSDTVGLALVDALNQSASSISLSPDAVAAVMRGYSPHVQKAGASLLKSMGVDVEQQQARLNELASLANGGDFEKGKAVFFGKKAACAGCHTAAGKGGRVGPDLSRIGRIRTARDLTESIVYPSASFAREFNTHTIITDAGRVHTGIISRRTKVALWLRTADLAEISIPLDQIDELNESPTSLMPQGIDKNLTAEEFRNLLAFLQGLK